MVAVSFEAGSRSLAPKVLNRTTAGRIRHAFVAKPGQGRYDTLGNSASHSFFPVSPMAWYFALPIYWLIVFVICYVVSEYAQNYLYDETTPALPLKLLGGTFLLAALLTKFRPSFDTMFTADIHWSILQAIVWFLVFMFIFRFHPKHAVTLGVITFLIVPGMATLGIDSLSGTSPAPVKASIFKTSKPIRRPAATFSPTDLNKPQATEKPAEAPGKN
ncbi:MAG TPA: hypothetical protein VGY53_00975 [Isosphaeraceae bacterium]|nr:hypothetical protein [Isosphaeraceae bacterium]